MKSCHSCFEVTSHAQQATPNCSLHSFGAFSSSASLDLLGAPEQCMRRHKISVGKSSRLSIFKFPIIAQTMISFIFPCLFIDAFSQPFSDHWFADETYTGLQGEGLLDELSKNAPTRRYCVYMPPLLVPSTLTAHII